MQIDYGHFLPASVSHAAASPDHMAVLGRLLGLEPPPVDRCRVLEIECGSGGNVFPSAWSFPESRFVGVDASPRNVAEAQATADQLGFRNTDFRPLALGEVDAELGRFDYIIAHGVYSWVDAEAQERLLAICGANLSENGVAYVSFNTYPGWHQVNAVRDAMRFHTRRLEDPRQRVQAARGLVRFLAESSSVTEAPYATFLRAYDEFLQTGVLAPGPAGDALLLSNELGAAHTPLYFHEFAERAARHGLQYLVDADFSSVTPDNVSGEDREVLLRISGDAVELEQYLDFITNRTFRGTLLCRAHLDVRRSLDPRSLGKLLIGSHARLSEAQEGTGFVVSDDSGTAIQADHLLTQAGLEHLTGVWPKREPFPALVGHAAGRAPALGAGGEGLAREALGMAVLLLRFYSRSAGLVTFSTADRDFVTSAGSCPIAIPYARMQAADAGVVTNVWHERVHLSEFQRTLLTLLDGSRTQEHLAEDLHFLDPAGLLRREAGESFPAAPPTLEQITATVSVELAALARSALLIA